MIRRRGRAPRRAHPARAVPAPGAPPAPVAPPAARPMPQSAHVVLQVGLRCHCGESAIRWTRCGVCRRLITTCGDHHKTFAEERAAHAATHPSTESKL